jgi:microcystin-dependent protein
VPSGATLDVTGATVSGLTTGKVLQVVQTLKTDTESVTGTSFADISGLNVAITPSASSSKVLIMLTMTYGGSGDIYTAFKLLRGSTVVTTATDLQGSCISSTFGANAYYSTNTENLSYTFLDSPSTTSATTYKIQVRPMATVSRTFYLNRPGDTGDANRYQGTTTLTAMEISA